MKVIKTPQANICIFDYTEPMPKETRTIDLDLYEAFMDFKKDHFTITPNQVVSFASRLLKKDIEECRITAYIATGYTELPVLYGGVLFISEGKSNILITDNTWKAILTLAKHLSDRIYCVTIVKGLMDISLRDSKDLIDAAKKAIETNDY